MSNQIKDFLEEVIRVQYKGRQAVFAEKLGLAPHTVSRMLSSGKINKAMAWRLQEALPQPYRNEFVRIYLSQYIAKDFRNEYSFFWMGSEVDHWDDISDKFNTLRPEQRALVRSFVDLLLFKPDTEKALGRWVDLDEASRQYFQTIIRERLYQEEPADSKKN